MISNRPMIPMLTHVDNLGDINLDVDMSTQEQLLRQISRDTDSIDTNVENIKLGQNNELNELDDISQNTTFLKTSVGLPADASSANTVIGLLKSISNKLTI